MVGIFPGGNFLGDFFQGGLFSRGHFSGHPIEDISEIHLRHEATVSDFGVSTAILNTIDISRGWCKLNFGPLQGQVKACHFC